MELSGVEWSGVESDLSSRVTQYSMVLTGLHGSSRGTETLQNF